MGSGNISKELASSEVKTSKFGWLPWFERTICIVFGLVFLWAGLAKLQQPYDFLSGLYKYRLFSATQGIFIAKVVPPLEIAIGIGLIFQIYLRSALFLASFMSLGFTIVRSWVINNGMEVECNCFGSQNPLTAANYIDWQSVAITFIQFSLLTFVFLRQFKQAIKVKMASPSRTAMGTIEA